jgi:hypothetical protein
MGEHSHRLVRARHQFEAVRGMGRMIGEDKIPLISGKIRGPVFSYIQRRS